MVAYGVGLLPAGALRWFSLVLTAACFGSAATGQVFWGNPAGGLFQDGANWASGNVPATDQDVQFGPFAGNPSYTVVLAAETMFDLLRTRGGGTVSLRSVDANPRALSIGSLDMVDASLTLGEAPFGPVNATLNDPLFSQIDTDDANVSVRHGSTLAVQGATPWVVRGVDTPVLVEVSGVGSSLTGWLLIVESSLLQGGLYQAQVLLSDGATAAFQHDLRLGSSGMTPNGATLIVTGGATLDVGNELVIGSSLAGKGTALIDSSTVTQPLGSPINGNLVKLLSPAGVPSTLTLSGLAPLLQTGAGGLAMYGADSRVDVETGELHVRGELRVEGTMEVDNTAVFQWVGGVPMSILSTGLVKLPGPLSLPGNNVITIASGGRLEVAGTILAGQTAGLADTLVIEGTMQANLLTVGAHQGEATVTVGTPTLPGSVDLIQLNIVAAAAGPPAVCEGTVLVQGGSVLAVDGPVNVGTSSPAAGALAWLVVQGGSSLVQTGTGDVVVGSASLSGTPSILTVDDSTLTTSGTGRLEVKQSGTVNLLAGGTLDLGGSLVVQAGQLNGTAGRVVIDSDAVISILGGGQAIVGELHGKIFNDNRLPPNAEIELSGAGSELLLLDGMDVSANSSVGLAGGALLETAELAIGIVGDGSVRVEAGSTLIVPGAGNALSMGVASDATMSVLTGSLAELGERDVSIGGAGATTAELVVDGSTLNARTLGVGKDTVSLLASHLVSVNGAGALASFTVPLDQGPAVSQVGGGSGAASITVSNNAALEFFGQSLEILSPGVVQLEQASLSVAFGNLVNEATLSLAGNSTVSVTGFGTSFMINEGTLQCTGTDMAIDGQLSNRPGGLISHTGSSLTVTGEFDQQGQVHLALGSQLTLNGAFVWYEPITGGGTVNAYERISLGGTGYGVGQLAGNLVLAPETTVELDVGGVTAGVDRDAIAVTGTVEIDSSTLALSIVAPYVPGVGDTLVIVSTTGGVTGQFGQLTGQYLGGGLYFALVYTPTSVVLEARLGGNVTGIGSVDAVDLATCLSQYNTSPGPYTADLDADNDVDQNDLGIVLNAYGLVTLVTP